MGRATIGLCYLLVVVVFVGISVWTIREGFDSFLHDLSWPIAVAFGVCLFAADVVIRNKRAADQSLIGPVFFLFVCMLLSAPSHFNYFYNYALGHIVTDEKLAKAIGVFDKNVLAAESRLRAADIGAKRVDTIRQEMGLLLQQIQDQDRPGWGSLASSRYQGIRSLVTLANVKEPALGSDTTVAMNFYGRLKVMVEEGITKISKENPITKTTGIIAGLKTEVSFLGQHFKKERRGGLRVNEAKRNAISSIAENLQKLESTVNQTLLEAGQKGWSLEQKPVDSESANTDGVAYSLRSGFIEMQYPHITALCSMATILIDIIPLLFALLLITPERPGPTIKDELDVRPMGGVEIN